MARLEGRVACQASAPQSSEAACPVTRPQQRDAPQPRSGIQVSGRLAKPCTDLHAGSHVCIQALLLCMQSATKAAGAGQHMPAAGILFSCPCAVADETSLPASESGSSGVPEGALMFTYHYYYPWNGCSNQVDDTCGCPAHCGRSLNDLCWYHWNLADQLHGCDLCNSCCPSTRGASIKGWSTTCARQACTKVGVLWVSADDSEAS